MFWSLIKMNSPQSTSSPHMYPQSLQLRLYQAFIFSIPILFSIILFLLFYLFYLKKSSSLVSSPEPALPISSNQKEVMKGKLKEKLEIIIFDDDLGAKDSMCCVCLGEFEAGEELHQIPTCKHVFHVDCICCWLHSNPTCPLCRGFIVSANNQSRISQPFYGPPNPIRQVVVNHNPQVTFQQQQEQVIVIHTDRTNT